MGRRNKARAGRKGDVVLDAWGGGCNSCTNPSNSLGEQSVPSVPVSRQVCEGIRAPLKKIIGTGTWGWTFAGVCD